MAKAKSGIIEERQGEEGVTHRLHAKVPNHPEYNDARQGSIQVDTSV